MIEQMQAEPSFSEFLQAQLDLSPQGFQLWQRGEVPAGFVYTEGQDYPVIWGCHLAESHLDELIDFLTAVLRPLQTAPETVAIALFTPGNSLVSKLGTFGFQEVFFLRQVQDLQQVPPEFASFPEGYRLTEWDAPHKDEFVRLLEAANQGTLDGLLLAFPNPPDLEHCTNLVDAILHGEHGTFLPDVSRLLFWEERLIGAVIMTQKAADEAYLFELVLDRSHQGKGLPRPLIRSIQEACRQKGLFRIRFASCQRNGAVGRLYQAAEIESHDRETDRLFVWMSDRYRARRSRRRS